MKSIKFVLLIMLIGMIGITSCSTEMEKDTVEKSNVKKDNFNDVVENDILNNINYSNQINKLEGGDKPIIECMIGESSNYNGVQQTYWSACVTVNGILFAVNLTYDENGVLIDSNATQVSACDCFI